MWFGGFSRWRARSLQRLLTAQRFGERTRYHVAILVQNQAVRVGYRWNDAIAYVTVASGARYKPTSPGVFVLQPGESRVATVTFDLPAGERGPALRFWDGIFMGDALNGGDYSKAAIALTP